MGMGLRRLALGTVQFGMAYGVSNASGRVPYQVAHSMVQFALTNGIVTFDTAIGYGKSEAVLGAIGMQRAEVVSKLLPIPAAISDIHTWVSSEVDASLARLGVDKLHGLMLHRSSDLSGSRGGALHEAILELKKTGKVRKFGISIYDPAELDALDGAYDFDLIQAPFNLVDHRLVRSGWLKRLKENGCEVHVRSAFLQGLLLMPRNAIPRKFTRWTWLWDRWHNWLGFTCVDPVHACLAYPLSFPAIDRVVVGALDVSQLRQIAISAGRPLTIPLPDLACEDNDLINPAAWSAL